MSENEAAEEGVTISGSVSRRLYRIVQTDPPTRSDFVPRTEAGWNWLDLTPEQQELSQGLSCFATLAQARKKAKKYPGLGKFVATLVIPGQSGIRLERTFWRSPGHHTIWGSPDEIASYVVEIRSVTK